MQRNMWTDQVVQTYPFNFAPALDNPSVESYYLPHPLSQFKEDDLLKVAHQIFPVKEMTTSSGDCYGLPEDWSIHAVDFKVELAIDDTMATLRVTYTLQYRAVCVFEQKLTPAERHNFIGSMQGGLSDGYGEDPAITILDKGGQVWDVRID